MNRVRRFALLVGAASLLALPACGGSGGSDVEKAVDAGGSATASGPPTAQTARVEGTNRNQFVPAEVQAKVGQLALTLAVPGGTPHDLAFDDPARAKVPLISRKEQTVQLTFDQAGSYDFVCTVHRGMVGRVVVS